MYLRFEDEYFYWELTYLLRKFCFVFVAVFIANGAVQLIASLVLILFFMTVSLAILQSGHKIFTALAIRSIFCRVPLTIGYWIFSKSCIWSFFLFVFTPFRCKRSKQVLLTFFTVAGLIFELSKDNPELTATRSAWIYVTWSVAMSFGFCNCILFICRLLLVFAAIVVIGAAVWNIHEYSSAKKMQKSVSLTGRSSGIDFFLPY